MKTSDFQTYRRLLTYLRGSRFLIILALIGMFIEAGLTVASISVIKPILDLLSKKSLTENLRRHAYPGMTATEILNERRETAAFAASGQWTTGSAELLLKRMEDLRATPARLLAVDLSAVTGLNTAEGTSTLERSYAAAEAQHRSLIVVLPPDVAPMRPLAADARMPTTSSVSWAIIAGSPMARPFIQAHLNGQQAKAAQTGFIANLRQSAALTVLPTIERVQRHADSGPKERFQVIAALVATMLILASLGVVAKVAVGYVANMLAAKAVQRLRDHTYQHMLTQDLGWFHQHSAGQLMSTLIQDAQAVDAALEILFSGVVKSPINVGALILAMFFVSPFLTVATFLAAPVAGGIIYVLGKRVRRVSGRIQLVKSILSGVLEETLNGMRIVKGYCTEQREAERFERANKNIYKLGLKTIAAQEIAGGLNHLVGIATIGIMVLGGGWFVVVQGKLAASDFALFIGFLSQVFRPLRDVGKVNAKLQRGLAGCDRVFATLDTHPTIVSPPDALEAGNLKKSIRFDNVSFRYSADRDPAVNEVSFEIPAGRAIALVGETGSGKSTLANLLPRFFDPTSGAVLWDGVDLRRFSLPSLRAQLALITQDVVLFDDTVAANIGYGCKRELTTEEIIEASKIARAHDFISRMPDGYNTRVGARGVRLSGGERQRIAIARALLRNAPVLILDEATSALDSETEALIQQALKQLFTGRTVLVIAHRLSTVLDCDEIIVLGNGRILERGTHADLISTDGAYARFYKLQSGTAT